MPNQDLFREEVIEKKRFKNLGTVFINTPVSYAIWAISFLLLTLSIILFFIFAEVSEKFTVKGYLNSNKGVVRVYAQKPGTIVRQYIKQGDKVKKGDRLFLINTSYNGLTNKNTNIEHHLLKRKQSLLQEIHNKSIYIIELKKLLEKKYIPLTTYSEKHEELVNLNNNMQLLDMEIIKYKQDLAYTILAPADGIISSLMVNLGQNADSSKPLLKLLPAHAQLNVDLFIPIQQSGFLNKQNKIIVRYDAYPYQRFGSYPAIIQTISQTILTDQEEEKPLTIGQPYYKVTAALTNQHVVLYGNKKKLQQDMTVTAVIVGSKRKIWQWILDPIYSYYGDLLG